MQFIDINCMLGEWIHNLRFKTAEELQEEMKRLNIVDSFVFHSRSWFDDAREGNDSIVSETKAHKNLIPVISLTSLIEQEFGGRNAIIDFIKANEIGAVKLFPSDHSYTLNPWNIEKLFSILDELKMPVLIECRPRSGSVDYNEIYETARIFKNTPIILLTVGYRGLRVFYEIFERCSNIHIDTSTFITYHGIEDVVKYFGPERILFGTRMPFIEAGVSVGRIIYADISQKDKEKIASGNALELLKPLSWLKTKKIDVFQGAVT